MSIIIGYYHYKSVPVIIKFAKIIIEKVTIQAVNVKKTAVILANKLL
jgi:hypothetical protein